MKKFKIYQLPIEHSAKYMPFDFLNENGIMPKLEDYKQVGESEVHDTADATATDLLEIIFIKLNHCHPDWFKGHSLSVSDVVELDGKFYYCDSMGWELLNWVALKEFRVIAVDAYGNDHKKYIKANDWIEAEKKVYSLGFKNVVDVVEL